ALKLRPTSANRPDTLLPSRGCSWFDFENLPHGDSDPTILLRGAGAAQVPVRSRDRESPAVDSALEFDAHLAARPSRAGTFVKVDERLKLPDIHRGLELDKFIFTPRGGAMVLVIVSIRRPRMLKEQGLSAAPRCRVKVEVDIPLPANPYLERADHGRRRRLGGFSAS